LYNSSIALSTSTTSTSTTRSRIPTIASELIDDDDDNEELDFGFSEQNDIPTTPERSMSPTVVDLISPPAPAPAPVAEFRNRKFKPPRSTTRIEDDHKSRRVPTF